MKHTLLIVIALLCAAACPAQTTLEACQQQAQQNYPLIKRRALYAQSTAYTIANIKKGGLPQVQVAAQGTVQNRVAQLPEQLSNMMAALGQSTRGLAKEQYRVGVDVNQMLWDGGRISAQKEVAQLQQQVDEAQTDVSLYQVRQRVNDLYSESCLLTSVCDLTATYKRYCKATKTNSLRCKGRAWPCKAIWTK